MNLKDLSLCEVREVALLHQKALQAGFLSLLGPSFLELLYKATVQSNFAFCKVVVDDGQVIGFVSGTLNTGAFYKEFLRSSWKEVFPAILPHCFSFRKVFKMAETLFYPAKSEALPQAELLSLAVSSAFRRQGVAEKLFQGLVTEFQKQGVKEFKVIVGEDLLPACRFYEKMGGALQARLCVHRGAWSRAYTFPVPLFCSEGSE